MHTKRRVMMAGATFFLAAATGHLMQNGNMLMQDSDALVQRFAQTSADASVQLAKADPATMDPVHIVPLAGTSEVAPPMVAEPAPLVMPEETVAADICGATLSLTAEPAAMVGLAYSAPCNPNARVVVRHSGLVITGLTSDTGAMVVSMPAMASAARFEVALPDGTKIAADIAVPTLANFDRMAVQWQGDDAFQLHAFEFGADYGDAGEVSAANARTPAFAARATGGFLTVLGNRAVILPMLAEVYTFPSVHSLQSGVVQMTVEAEVTTATCGRDMLGETLQAGGTAPVKIVDLTLEMPACDAIGDIVILNTLLPEVKIAHN